MSGLFWIASYPKSGNTWVRCLVASLLTGAAAPDLAALGRICPSGSSRAWLEEVLDIPTEDLTPDELARIRPVASREWAATGGTGPLCLKVHDCHDPRLFPPDVATGAVYVVRDPRDVAPSWGDHMNVSVDEAIARMGRPGFILGRSIRGFRSQTEQVMGSWSENVTSWLDQTAVPVLLLRYEDLMADPLGETTRLAAFLGLAAAPESITRAVAACRFEALQAAEASGGFSEKPDGMERFFRQGRSGAWREGLSQAQAARVVADHGAVLTRLSYER